MNTNTPTPTNGSRLLDGWIHICRAGQHVASTGEPVQFSTADLDQMAANQSLGAAPIVLGHPKTNDPAFGWSAEMRRDGNDLYARFQDVVPEFAQAVDTGYYRNRSVSVYHDPAHGWRVRHIGYLGAAQPAIAGLNPMPVQFCAAEADCLEFSEPIDRRVTYALDDVADLMRGLRDAMIERDGVEATDRVLPSWRIDSISEMANALRVESDQDGQRLFSQSPTGDIEMPNPVTPNTDALAAARANERATVEAEFSQRLQAAEQRAAAAETAQRQTRITGQIDGWVNDGKVLPAERPGLAEFMASLEAGATVEFEFAQADGAAPVKKTPAQWFAEFMAARAPVLKLGRQPQGGDPVPADDDSQALADRAREFVADQAAKGITVSVTDAMTQIKKG